MEHPVSVLYHPFNKLLIALFGESSPRYQELMGLHEAGYWLPDHVVMAMLVVVLVAAVLIPTSRRLSVESPGKLQQIFELLIKGVGELIEDVVGHGFGKRFLPFIMGLAVFIFVSNIFGLFYFVQPPTANPNTTFALSITAFLFYNIVGIKDNGLFKYLKHFAGPLPLLAPLMVPIEIISHLLRPFTLGVRLFANMYAGHIMLGVFAIFMAMALEHFTAVGALVLPLSFLMQVVLRVFELFVAVLQAYIFSILTAVYINGALHAGEH